MYQEANNDYDSFFTIVNKCQLLVLMKLIIVILFQKSLVFFVFVFIFLFIFFFWVFFDNHSRITGLQGKGEGIYLTPHCHFHPLHRHVYISQTIIAESSPLHIGNSRTRTGNLWFPSASREPLSYAPSSSCLTKRAKHGSFCRALYNAM